MLKISVLLIICLATRLIPHLANATPLIAVCLTASLYLPLLTVSIITLCGLLLSNIGLALLYGYPWIGNWAWFVGSGFLMVIMSGLILRHLQSFWPRLNTLIIVNFNYWLWTNFGTWAYSGMYSHTQSGLASCYIAALPFLRHSIIINGLAFILYHAYTYRKHTSMKRVMDHGY